MIIHAYIMPHAPILLPDVGSEEDRARAKKTIEALEKVAREVEKLEFDKIIISSPHEDWGFDVPLRFALGQRVKDKEQSIEGKIKKILTGFETPKEHCELGKKFAQNLDKDKKYLLIASGDLSHRLKEDGPYGFNAQGPKFDQELIQSVRTNALYNIFSLEEKYPEAADCGLRSFCFALGALEASKTEIRPKIYSYEGPFGVGYLVAKLR